MVTSEIEEFVPRNVMLDLHSFGDEGSTGGMQDPGSSMLANG